MSVDYTSKEISNIIDEIYNEIIKDALIDHEGIFWPTIKNEKTIGLFERGVQYGISNGQTGIILFLLEYYKYSPNNQLKDIIHQSLVKTNFYYRNQGNSKIGFYNGKGGLIYALTKASKYLQVDEYLVMAKQSISTKNENTKPKCFNLDTGLSGYLLGVIHYYVATMDKEVLPIVQQLLKVLVSNLKVVREGVYWDELTTVSGPFCSFLYGNSGIIFVLNELEKIFRNLTLRKIIDEAKSFENNEYDTLSKNWLDYRNEKKLMKLDLRRSFPWKRTKDYKLFQPSITFSWSIGSPGMLLSRYNEESGNSYYKKSLNEAKSFLNVQVKDTKKDYTIYNGLGGIYLSISMLDSSYYYPEFFKGIIAQKKKYGNLPNGYINKEEIDFGFFKGESGIGYMLLNTFYGRGNVDTVLGPILNLEKTEKIDIEHFELLPIKSFFTKKTNIFPKLDLNKNYFQYIEDLFKYKSTEYQGLDYVLDKEVFKLSQVKLNFLLEYQLYIYHNRNNVKYKDLRLTDHCRLVNFDSKNRYLLIRFIGGVYKFKLDDFTYTLYEKCNTPMGIKLDKLQQIVFKMNNKLDPLSLKELLDLTIREAIRKRILTGGKFL